MIDTQELRVHARAARAPCIGIFDSGVGGLSILRALRARVGDASMIYVGDVANAPYGDRPAEHVVERSRDVAAWLIEQGAAMIVVACNTATVLAIESLRARWPSIVFVGVEPGVKPAAARSRTQRIGVMATAATAGSARLRHLIERYASDAHVHVQPCPGLADAIERGVVEGAELRALLTPHCEALRAAAVDTVVLGCTHYPIVETTIRELLGPDITLIDTATAVAERSASLWEQLAPVFDAAASARVISTGGSATMAQLLRACPGLGATDVEVLTIIPCASPG
ncbi:MAG: glutamate racemase [Pseudomonadota bacterium]